MNTTEIELRKLELQEKELHLREVEMYMNFAKYGFFGTLAAGLAGMALVIVLALIDVLSPNFTYGTWGIGVTLICLVVICAVFGFLSLRKPMKILAKFGKLELGVNEITH